MTVLAQEPAFGVAFAGFKTVMNIIFDKLVELGVQFWLLITFGGEGTAVRKLHESLVGHTNAFATVMTGVTGLHRYAVPGLAGTNDTVMQHVPLLLLVDGRVVAFVITVVAIQNMTG